MLVAYSNNLTMPGTDQPLVISAPHSAELRKQWYGTVSSSRQLMINLLEETGPETGLILISTAPPAYRLEVAEVERMFKAQSGDRTLLPRGFVLGLSKTALFCYMAWGGQVPDDKWQELDQVFKAHAHLTLCFRLQRRKTHWLMEALYDGE